MSDLPEPLAKLETALASKPLKELPVLPEVVEVTDSQTYQEAADLLNVLEEARKEGNLDFDPQIDGLSEVLARIKAQKRAWNECVQERVDYTKAQMRLFVQVSITAQENQRKRLEELATSALHDEARKALPVAVKSQDLETVQEIAQTLNTSVTVPGFEARVPKARGVRTSYFWNVEVIDVEKLHSSYYVLKKSPKMLAIKKTVRTLGEDAPEEIGPGSIRVFRDSEVVRSGKKTS